MTLDKSDSSHREDGIDWSLTTWEGARREQLRRWSELPLEQAIMAVEEMEELSRLLQPPQSSAVEERDP